MSDQKNYTFKAEIKQLLDILIHSLYKEKDIFVRELISNASDAITRLQFEMLTNSKVVDPEAELAIHIETKKPEEGEDGDHWLIIKDSGIGMTAKEMQKNLGTIAQSGAREFLSKMEDGEKPADLNDVIGQFGVGFYSVFMAGSEVEVVSRSYKPQAKPSKWISDGGESYKIEDSDKSDRGTEIHIKLRDDAKEFADSWQLRQVVKKHSDFVAFPIYIDGEQANQTESLWRKQPSEVDEEAYKSFYQQMTMDFEEPLSNIHFSSDAPLNLRALLFIPSKREKTMFHKRTEPGVMLYSKNILIQEYSNDILPKWLQFVDGVVDSEDLPLNVSRESIQNTRFMRQLGKTITKRVVRTLKKLASDDEEKFEKFWAEFGRFFKEGLGVVAEDRDEIMPLLYFTTSKSDGKLVNLDTYISRKPEEQTKIYYVLGDDAVSVANSPHLEPFKDRDIEILFFTDAFDAFMAPSLSAYKDLEFQSIDEADLELPDIEPAEKEEGEDDTPAIDDEKIEKLIERFKSVLGEKITDVRTTERLTTSPMRLVQPEEGGPSAMSRLYRYVEQNYEVPKRIVELNPKNKMIANIAEMNGDESKERIVALSIEQLYDTALLQEGLHPNPADMIPRLNQLVEIATSGS